MRSQSGASTRQAPAGRLRASAIFHKAEACTREGAVTESLRVISAGVPPFNKATASLAWRTCASKAASACIGQWFFGAPIFGTPGFLK